MACFYHLPMCGCHFLLRDVMTDTKNFEDFATAAYAAGFDQALERRWEPHTMLDVHTHNFDAEALVTQGEMWLTCNGATQYLTKGSRFTIAREVPHTERYGSQGATYWVARRIG